jgi:hypothetical protein
VKYPQQPIISCQLISVQNDTHQCYKKHNPWSQHQPNTLCTLKLSGSYWWLHLNHLVI